LENKDMQKLIEPSIPMLINKGDSCIGCMKAFLEKPIYKCISFIDGDCSGCLINLPAINKEMNTLSNIECVYVVKTFNVKTFKAYCDFRSLKLNVAFDTTDVFFKENKLSNSNFILLSPENHIISLGNPILEKGVMKIYRRVNKKKTEV